MMECFVQDLRSNVKDLRWVSVEIEIKIAQLKLSQVLSREASAEHATYADS